MQGPRELLPGIYRITTTPPPSGWMTPTSCYLVLSGSEALLVDPGYRGEEVSEILGDLLPKDLPLQVAITHGHLDHYGAAAALEVPIQRVLVHEGDLRKVAIGTVNELLERREEVERHWQDLGFPHPQGLWEVLEGLRPLYPEGVPALHPLPREIPLGEKVLKVIHTPGHTSGSVCLWLEREGVLLSGDTLLPPGHDTWLSGPCFGEEGAGPGDYSRSLRKIALLGPRLLLPGHGEPFEDVRGRLLEISRRSEERKTRIMGVLAGPMTAYEISLLLDPGVEGFLRLLSVAQFYADLIDLAEQGRVEAVGEAPVRWKRP